MEKKDLNKYEKIAYEIVEEIGLESSHHYLKHGLLYDLYGEIVAIFNKHGLAITHGG